MTPRCRRLAARLRPIAHASIGELIDLFAPWLCLPRARKRRLKNYQLLNKPRREFREIQHRNRYSRP